MTQRVDHLGLALASNRAFPGVQKEASLPARLL